MSLKCGKNVLLALSLMLGIGSFAPQVYASTDSEIKKVVKPNPSENFSKITMFLEKKREERAKEIIESVPESSPLTLESKVDIVEYYAETYIPKEGCSLLELPADSDINYVPPKPKPKKKAAKASSSKSIISKTSEKSSRKISTYEGKSITMTKEEREWLEKLVEAEATGESYEGKLAVATVIANRLESPSFPNTVMDVIKQTYNGRHQFQPWDDGRIYKMTPSADTKKAVTEVFDNGVRNLPKETVYFAMKNIAFDDWQGKTRKHITTIGVHAFFSEYPKY